MDPLTQGVLGASVPQNLARPERLRAAAVIGFLAGLLADIDIFFTSPVDALLALEFHRQFTHSLIFIPIGGLVSALALYWFFKKQMPFKSVYLYATLGYGTHGLLDACTTYGTQLFWPFSNYRVAWNYISIIDPLFTLPFLILVGISFYKKSQKLARWALSWAAFYMFLGFCGHHWAVNVGKDLAMSRGHSPDTVDAKPSFGNIVLWKLIYQTEDAYYVDAVRLGASPKIFKGDRAVKFNLERDFPDLPPSSRQAQDIKRFAWFSNGYIAVHPDKKDVIGDIRYSMVPNQIDPLWGIQIDSSRPEDHVKFLNLRNLESRREFFKMLGF